MLLHTCAGISEHERSWPTRLVEWGYAALTVDSLKPRNVDYICDGRPGSVTPFSRALDAFGAKRFFSNREDVDATRIAIMGMSHGGSSALAAVKQATIDNAEGKAFRGAVAFYPLCGEPEPMGAPGLILIGENDDWTLASLCQDLVDRMVQRDVITVRILPGAHHGFDHPDIDILALGYIVRSNPDATREATPITRDFLDRHLTPTVQ